MTSRKPAYFLSPGSLNLLLIAMRLFIKFIDFESADLKADDDRCPCPKI